MFVSLFTHTLTHNFIMIRHVVLFKLHPFAEGNSKHENALYIKRKLEGLQSVIPELQNIDVLINMPGVSADNYDLMLITEFKSLADLKVYANHPAHQEVVTFISKVRTDRAAIDYEV